MPNVGVDGMFEKIMYYCPSTLTLNEYKGSKKLLMKRYANVERVNESEIIGLLMGTVTCDNHMQILN